MIETFFGLTFAGLALLGVKIGVVVLLAALTVFLSLLAMALLLAAILVLFGGDGKLTVRLAGLELKKTRQEADNGS